MVATTVTIHSTDMRERPFCAGGCLSHESSWWDPDPALSVYNQVERQTLNITFGTVLQKPQQKPRGGFRPVPVPLLPQLPVSNKGGSCTSGLPANSSRETTSPSPARAATPPPGPAALHFLSLGLHPLIPRKAKTASHIWKERLCE